MLKQIALVYNTLALFCPVTLQGNLFVQELFNKKQSLDDKLSSQDKEKLELHKGRPEEFTQLQISKVYRTDTRKSGQDRGQDYVSARWLLWCIRTCICRDILSIVDKFEEEIWTQNTSLRYSWGNISPFRVYPIYDYTLFSV